MEETYDILLAESVIGTATVKRTGLYYIFHCRCSLSGDVLYKIIVQCGERQESLGICVPQERGFGIETKVPTKRLGEGKFIFRLVPKHAALTGRFVPVRAEEPFAYIDKLHKAHLEIHAKQPGIVFLED